MNVLQILKSRFLGDSERSNNVKKNAFASLLIKIGAMILQFIQVPIVLSYLDKNTYGVYLTISSIVLWVHNFDLGLGQGLRYKLTEAISLKKVVHAKELVTTSYISLSLIMGIAMIICSFACYFINWQTLFQYYEESNLQLYFCVLIVLGSFLIRFVLDLISVVLQAHQLTAVTTSFGPIANILSIIGVVVLKCFSHNSLLLACVMLSVPLTIVLLVANIVLFRSKYRQIAPDVKFYRKDCLKDIYNLGLKFFVSSLAGLVVFNTSSLLLSHYVGPSDTAVYQTAYMYMGAITTFTAVLSSPLMAGITDAYVNREYNWLKNCYRRFTQVTVIASLGCVILLAISPIVYKIWLHGRLDIPFAVSATLCLFFIGNLWSSMFNCFVTGAGKAFLSMVIAVGKIILFLPTAIYLIKFAGIVGLVFATILINTVPNVILCWIQSRKIVYGTLSGFWNK
jgi:O-antigen/teichoic acid export membrane protein